MDDLARRHQQIQAELAQIGIALPGSLTSRTTRCQRPSCHCHATPPILHGPAGGFWLAPGRPGNRGFGPWGSGRETIPLANFRLAITTPARPAFT